MQEAPFTPAELALEQTGLEFLRNGKFRKARDAFKSLHKSQPTRALPLLIDANLGLASEMMAKGLVSEANQVLAYLKTIAPAACNLALTPVTAANPRDAWAAMVPLAAQRLASSTPQSDVCIRAADEMILGASSPDHPGHPDAQAILTALELGYGAAAAAETTRLLRTVPRASPFSHWVLFFKGMTALESGAHARAADCFRRVPEISLLHPSISALLTLCGAPATPQPSPCTVRALCTWAGLPNLAEPLLLAEPLWRKKQRSKAFTLLTKKVPDLFCWGARSFNAELTRFLATEFVRDHLEGNDYFDVVLDYIHGSSRTIARATVDQAFFSVDFSDFSACAHSHFSTALKNLEGISRVAPLSPGMHSRIFTHLAENYIAAIKNDPGDLCSPPNAKKALEHALTHDPGNLRAWLMQCDLLSMGKDSAAYHRFLDDLTKRFPAQKEVLIRNGDCCTDRKTYTKALRNFESAAKFDAVDPRIARGILRARLGIAEEAYKKRQPSKANWELIESLASSNKSCAEHSLWRLRVRRIVLEARRGMTEKELVALTAATLPLSPNAFLLEAACRLGIVKYDLTFKEETLEKMFPSRPAPESLADFLAVMDEVAAFEGSSHFATAKGVARQIFAAHDQRLLRFVAGRKDLTAFLIKLFNSSSPNVALASPVIQEWFRRDPADPLLLVICSMYTFPWLPSPPTHDPKKFAAQLRDSPDPDNRRLLLLLQKADSRYGGNSPERAPKLDLDYDPHAEDEDDCDDDDDDDDDDEDDDDEYSDDDIFAFDQAMGKMNPAELMKALNSMLGSTGLPGLGNFIDPRPNTRPPSKR